LTGLFEADNGIKGFDSKQPILIGDEHRALQVYLDGQGDPKLIQHKPLSLELIKLIILTHRRQSRLIRKKQKMIVDNKMIFWQDDHLLKSPDTFREL
jgi:hypothetical protein